MTAAHLHSHNDVGVPSKQRLIAVIGGTSGTPPCPQEVMMAEVHADPSKLRRFAKTVSASARELDRLSRELRRSLGETDWEGRERRRFEREFKQTLASISELAEQLRSQYVAQLEEKADALDRFRS